MAVTSIALLMSCSRDDDPKPAPPKPTPPPVAVTPDAKNDFVWRAMNYWYYWQNQVPNLADSKKTNTNAYAEFVNGFPSPDKLFYSLLYQYGTVDRFSWIENNGDYVSSSAKLINTAEVEKTNGLDLSFFQINNQQQVIALVNYVIPNSSADKAGILRGDIIYKVNGSLFYRNNFSQMFNANSYKVTIAESINLINNEYVVSGIKNEADITTTELDENPIAAYKKFDLAGKKIGYLVFNSFKTDYNDELNKVFGEMKADGINELILDLRYNGGGKLNTAMALGYMISGKTGNYVYMEWNNKNSEWSEFDNLVSTVDYFKLVDNYPEQEETVPANTLNLPRVFVLTSQSTASASELTILGLSKYITVETIGRTTYGKFVGSISLWDAPEVIKNNRKYKEFTSREDRNTSHNWMLQPITFSYKNKDKEPVPAAGGLPPKHEINSFAYLGTLKEFGNESDPALKKALDLITGQSSTGKLTNKNYPNFPTFEKSDRVKVLNIDDINRHIERFRK